ncbi:hypothetical protein PoB_000692200 [Plakobranchus ocellatus]|uniref:Uncharacterized protein n=1 Tax=Plakobranchus ocellatus TaxID=259542 RepID=A0AAV3YBZ8_9GAST|nr:hypothetical protein PoB_000692200 [Plakobranchus ocellatus]
MTQPYPAALVIASLESVCIDNNVLYRLVRPLADGSGVESTERLVNVVPHRRTYCFERKEQVESFRDEILRRPLVIQPVLHFGRGIGPSCGACYNDEPWVVMINQTHPKILGRLQMGLELARTAVAKGQSVEIKLRFGKLIERVYREHLQQKEAGEAASERGFRGMLSRALLPFRFAEWDHGDLTLRSHGLAAKLKTSTPLMLELNNLDMTWDFEDVGMHDMMWNQLQPELVFSRPHLASVSEDEIRAVLPGWTVNAVTPLEAIGEAAPTHSYSYAQAGRLYASFRKVRKSNDKNPYHNRLPDTEDTTDQNWTQRQGGEAISEHWAPEGAEAMPQHWYSHTGDVPHNQWSSEGAEGLPQNWTVHDAERNLKSSDHSPYDHLDDIENDNDHHLYQKSELRFLPEVAHNQSGKYSGWTQADKYGHIMPQVHIQQPGQASTSLHNLKKQDSDRSSRSTNADSGYCPGTDDGGQRSRGSSYDLNDYSSGSKGFASHSFSDKKQRSGSNDDLSEFSLKDQYAPPYRFTNLSNGHGAEGGLENPAFSMPETKSLDSDMALQSHRDFVKRVLAEDQNVNGNHNFVNTSPKNLINADTAPPTKLHTSSGSASSLSQIAESFI